jgi:hypothetical protein
MGGFAGLSMEARIWLERGSEPGGQPPRRAAGLPAPLPTLYGAPQASGSFALGVPVRGATVG